MGLQTQIKKDLAAAMKAKDDVKKNAIRVILGEFGRLEKKELSDDDVLKVLKKLIKSEKEMLQQSGRGLDSEFLKVVESYLPQMVSDAEIAEWIRGHIDFSQYKNKMQAMGAIMGHFGPTADGSRVKQILQNL
jgi:uncharacterized protein YqeY